MKVSDVMQRHVDFVDEDAKILDISRIIFGRRINGVPVCDKSKVVGFISETDILAKLHPTIQEFAENPFVSTNFEEMEKKAKDVLWLTAKDIMSKRPILINKEDPLMKADSAMRIENVGRLPVVDDKGNLVGIISMGDIFKAIVGKNVPYFENEEYHDWMTKHFSFAMGWNEGKAAAEIPPLVALLKRSGAKKILDIECGTGDYSIALAKEGFRVLGLEGSEKAIEEAKARRKKLPVNVKKNVNFIGGDYTTTSLSAIKEHYDAAIFMNSSFMHLPNIYSQVLEKLDKLLSKKNALIVLQLSNYEKAIKHNNNLRRFVVRNSKIESQWKHAYLWFYDPPEKKGDLLLLNVAIFDFDGRTWMFRGLNRVATKPFTREELKTLFNRFDFPQVSFYGAEVGESLFNGDFKQDKSEWLVVVAKR